MTIGGVNETFINSNSTLEYLPLCSTAPDSDATWSVHLVGFTINGTSRSEGGCAIIDSGTSDMAVTLAVGAKLFGLIPGSQAIINGTSGYYTFPCDASTDIQVGVIFGTRTYYLDFYDFVAEEENGVCTSVITVGPDMLVGDMFRESQSFRGLTVPQ